MMAMLQLFIAPLLAALLTLWAALLAFAAESDADLPRALGRRRSPTSAGGTASLSRQLARRASLAARPGGRRCRRRGGMVGVVAPAQSLLRLVLAIGLVWVVGDLLPRLLAVVGAGNRSEVGEHRAGHCRAVRQIEAVVCVSDALEARVALHVDAVLRAGTVVGSKLDQRVGGVRVRCPERVVARRRIGAQARVVREQEVAVQVEGPVAVRHQLDVVGAAHREVRVEEDHALEGQLPDAAVRCRWAPLQLAAACPEAVEGARAEKRHEVLEPEARVRSRRRARVVVEQTRRRAAGRPCTRAVVERAGGGRLPVGDVLCGGIGRLRRQRRRQRRMRVAGVDPRAAVVRVLRVRVAGGVLPAVELGPAAVDDRGRRDRTGGSPDRVVRTVDVHGAPDVNGDRRTGRVPDRRVGAARDADVAFDPDGDGDCPGTAECRRRQRGRGIDAHLVGRERAGVRRAAHHEPVAVDRRSLHCPGGARLLDRLLQHPRDLPVRRDGGCVERPGGASLRRRPGHLVSVDRRGGRLRRMDAACLGCDRRVGGEIEACLAGGQSADGLTVRGRRSSGWRTSATRPQSHRPRGRP